MTRTRFRRTPGRGAAALPALLLAGAAALIAGRAAADEPSFTAGRCSPGQISPDLLRRVRCGTVAVLRDRGHPDRGSFALAEVVVASATRPARPDPDLSVSGGPGGP